MPKHSPLHRRLLPPLAAVLVCCGLAATALGDEGEDVAPPSDAGPALDAGTPATALVDAGPDDGAAAASDGGPSEAYQTYDGDLGIEGFDAEETTPQLRPMRPGDVARGERAYRSFCATCHGVSGLGDGPTAPYLATPPRDFVRAEYKWRSTPIGSLPTDGDLYRTISEGIPGTKMPAWRDRLPDDIRWALARYVLTLARSYESQKDAPVITIPEVPNLDELRAEGERLYREKGCFECHGMSGTGDGPAAAELKDWAGRPIDAYDLTSASLKGGNRPEDIYRTLTTGLGGTPMPAYDDAMTPAQRWALVAYVQSLQQSRGFFTRVLDYFLTPLSETR